MKKNLLLFFTLLYSSLAFSQQVTGVVTDLSGESLPGVSVLVKGTTIGAITNVDGEYTIKAKESDVLNFSFIGMLAKEVTVGSSSIINISLELDDNQLDEVVVTAFGVEKKEKSLGYSVTQIKTEDINMDGQLNAFQSLQGRVAGVQINQTSGTSGGGVDILIRGITSVNPSRSNQPLIIVDGIALNNDTFAGEVRPSTGSNSPSSSEQFGFSNRAMDINPDDIESFNVLKGAAATALYGVRASNGAIIITTKRGKKGKTKINVTASTTFKNVAKTPTQQTTYREGFNGAPRTLYAPNSLTGFERVQQATSFYAWGPKYSDDSYTLDDGTVIDLTGDQYYSPFDIFQQGVNNQINFNLSGAGDKLDYYMSLGKSNEIGILPNTDYEKTNFRIKTGYQVTKNFKLGSSVAYTKSGGKRANGGDKSVMSALSYYTGTFPINDYQNADGSERDYSFGIIDNPRYLLEKSNLQDDVNRWLGSVNLNYAPTNWLSLTYLAQIDNYSDRRNRFVTADLDGGSQVGGFIVNQNINFTGLESNFLATLSKDFSDDFSSRLTLGHQVSDTKTIYDEARGEGLNVPGINEIGNTTNFFINNTVSQLRNVGVFGELVLGYKDKLFLTATGRNDWLSTMPKENRSFFYPSVSVAYDISSWFKDSNLFSFGKLRASWAEVGKGPGFGDIGQYFTTDGDFPFGGVGGYRRSSLLGDLSIVPERNRSIELGADFRFLKDRIRLDYAFFKTRVSDQIFGVSTAYSSGLSKITRNAGDYEVFGHEFLLSADIIRKDNIKWQTIFNWSTSEGKVLEIPEDIESIIFADAGFAGVTSEIRQGDNMGNLYGYKWEYVNGQRYIDSNGYPVINTGERVLVGNAFPDFVSSINNIITWKDLSLNFLLEYKKGGDLYDSGLRNALRNGLLEKTVVRDQEVVLEGLTDDGEGGYTVNTTPALIDANYYRNSSRYNRASEILVQDASWLKLRNVSLSYNLNSRFLKQVALERATVSVSAGNFILWTPFDGFDPEGNQYSAGSNVYGFTGLSVPLSQSFSVGLNLQF